MTLIKTIIFDFGDVLVTDTAKVYKTNYSRRWSKRQATAFHRIFHQDDIGQLSLPQLAESLHKHVTPAIGMQKTESVLTSFKLFKPTWRLAQRLKRRYQVIILSNNSKAGPAYIAKKLKISYAGIPFVNSSVVKAAKPHKKIFRYAIKKCRVDPHAAVFIDDKQHNLIAAKKFGMKTFRYAHNYGKLVAFLKKQGVKV